MRYLKQFLYLCSRDIKLELGNTCKAGLSVLFMQCKGKSETCKFVLAVVITWCKIEVTHVKQYLQLYLCCVKIDM